MAHLCTPPSRERQRHRQNLIAHRRERSLALGPRMWLQFEDELTVHHQIQEVLRAEPGAKLQHETDTYAHLLPDGNSWKATLLIELAGASATLGCAHDQYAFRRLIPLATLERLRCDLVTHRHD